MSEEQNETITQEASQAGDTSKETKTWAMFLHLSMLSGFLIPFAGLVAPIIIWQLKKSELPGLDVHGKNATNWLISAFIYGIACFVLTFIIIGIPLMFVLAGLCVVFPIIAGIKANNGEVWKYPMSLDILK